MSNLTLFLWVFTFQSVHEGRIYQLKLFCDKDYPEKPPTVRFHSRVNMTCVNHETGVVKKKTLSFASSYPQSWFLLYITLPKISILDMLLVRFGLIFPTQDTAFDMHRTKTSSTRTCS